jgi:hypothetical protein
MKTYYKLGIDSDLWRLFKTKCAAEGISMLSALEKLIKLFVNGKLKGSD